MGAALGSRRRRSRIMDLIYVLGVLGFLALTFGLVRLCERVS
jgi:hypothetical protein